MKNLLGAASMISDIQWIRPAASQRMAMMGGLEMHMTACLLFLIKTFFIVPAPPFERPPEPGGIIPKEPCCLWNDFRRVQGANASGQASSILEPSL